MSASDLLNSIDKSRLPQHVAVIMDGNGRWAKQHGKARVFGHTNGVNSVRQVSEAAAELGIKYLTLYAFSTENWNRPKFEVEALMLLLVDTINKEIATMMKNNISLKAIGNLDGLPSASRKALEKGIEETSNNTGLSMVLALNYSGREEITTMVKKIAIAVKEEKLQLSEINDNLISTSLYTHDIPDPELLIRTSGEHRVSNFLLWQMAYTEFYFTPVMWPDFGKEQFYLAINDYQNRERRFGKTSEQVK
ncbi:MAG: isoprenyl transferase [Saprospiraceae bacterium]|jgi:undecaprenyl diphosphate synthase|uniref:isoprenyl transferase n=1 Tax=Candidatus Brachybacter algidus TaxID=2982024 RepID=UPI001B44FBCF|nr:isoprenyl transferase [Candidatus Brachybacter algidus]MBP7304684.1 isoprenyl transferase [Saprospiraceae bacterium]MBK7603592.1 isoprenyl transferase [Candidatus Brachybacter algidus]MBK8357003.1 isoprenyl transferase [Candidatus Brachybacter algidus]MBK8601801.1 isoprenyl transferase [Candidatus Brachybacter algidus]MBK9024311.1 isoprenyl transferase [Candidatus Brachybacter algidus]